MNLFEVSQLKKTYSSHKKVEKNIFENLNFAIHEKEFVSILGPSGCGKSTLLKVLAGLEQPSAGSIRWVNERPLGSFVFQEPRLVPWKTVTENILLPGEITNPKNLKKQLDEILKITGLSLAKDLYPFELSGGMKMRSSIARALITSPTVLWMDEPFSALDENTRNELQEELYKIYVTEKATVLFVTHSILEAVFLSQRIFIMNPRGEICFEINVDLPKNRISDVRNQKQFHDLVSSVRDKFRQVVRD